MPYTYYTYRRSSPVDELERILDLLEGFRGEAKDFVEELHEMEIDFVDQMRNCVDYWREKSEAFRKKHEDLVDDANVQALGVKLDNKKLFKTLEHAINNYKVLLKKDKDELDELEERLCSRDKEEEKAQKQKRLKKREWQDDRLEEQLRERLKDRKRSERARRAKNSNKNN